MTRALVTAGLFDTLDAAVYVAGVVALLAVPYYWREFRTWRQWQLRNERYWRWLHGDDA